MVTRREVICGGEPFSILEWTGDHAASSMPVVFSHATGFNAQAYEPLLTQIAERANVYAIDARGHGQTTAASTPERLTSWHVYYRDLVAFLDTLASATKVILAGHSMGATANAFAAAQRPERVAGLIMVEPVFYPPLTGEKARQALMASASRRKSDFESLKAAFASYRPRSAFAGFTDAFLWSYISGAFKPTPSGTYTLRCSNDWERRSYETNEPWPWWAIARTRAPASLLLAARASSCPPSARSILRILKPSWELDVVPDTTHLLPMERPDAVVAAVQDMIDTVSR